MARSAPHKLLAAAAGLLLVLCLAPTSLAARPLLHPGSGRQLTQTGGLSLPCAVIGGAAGPTWLNAPLTCLELYEQPGYGPQIAPPEDTATSKYGQIIIQQQTMDGAISAFVDRNGKQYPLSASANAPTNATQLERIFPLLIVQAQVDPASGNVTSFEPFLYVPYSTVMSTFKNMQFEGALFNSPPRVAGPNETSYFRWTFGNQITVTDPTYKYGTLLQGSFDNLFRAVKDSHGVCRPALCADPTLKSPACQYYTKFFGTSSDMTLNWDPNMHMPVDTELVPMFPATGRQYMASFVELYQLLQPYAWARQFTFFGHGTPMGTPQSFTGTFTPAKPVQFC